MCATRIYVLAANRGLLLVAWVAVSLLSGCKTGGGGTQVLGGSIAASPLDFGTLPVGDSNGATMTIEAIEGSVTILGLQIERSGATDSPQDFTVAALPEQVDLSTDVGADAGTTASVSFHPSAPGSRTATLSIAYDPSARGGPDGGGGSATIKVPISGVGVAAADINLQVDPVAIDFGPIQIGDFANRNVTVHNTNTFPVSVVFGAADGGFDGGAFSVPVSRLAFAGNETKAIPVTFVPAQTGDVATALPVAACEACPVRSVALSGQGVNASLTFSPEAVNFGFVLDGTFAAPAPVTVSVTGNVPVQVLNVFPLQHRTTVFNVAALPPLNELVFYPDSGARTFTFDVTYTPSTFPGGDYDQVEVDYAFLAAAGTAAATKQTYLTLTGNVLPDSCDLVVSPADTLDFGSVVPGQSVTKSLRMINAGGADCLLTSVQLAAGSDSAFSLGQSGDDGGISMLDGGIVVPAHAELQGLGLPGLPVTFAAPHDSPRYHRSATVTFTSNDARNATGSIHLTGTLASAYSTLSPWPKWGHDNANTGQGEVDTSLTDGGLLWSLGLVTAGTEGLAGCATTQGGYYVNAPVLGGDRTLFMVGCDGTFYAIDELGGSVLWRKQLQAPAAGTYTTPAVFGLKAASYSHASVRRTPAFATISLKPTSTSRAPAARTAWS